MGPMGSGFAEGFLKSWGVILASEIGDKTFFIAAILAMRHSRKLVRRPAARLHAVLGCGVGRRHRWRRRPCCCA